MNKLLLIKIIEWFKDKLYFLRPILRPLYLKMIANKQNHLRNELFLSNAIDVLEIFDKAMRLGGYNYTLAFGSLLGAVREKGFIKHDFDIDTAMWASDYDNNLPKLLSNYGFKRIHCYTIDNGESAREETYELKGVSIDIFYFYPAIDEFPYCCDFLNHEGKESFKESIKRYSDNMIGRRIQLPLDNKIVYCKFNRLTLPIPANSHDILLFRYGPDFMTPNPNWSMTSSYNKYITDWEGKKVKVE